MGQVYVDDPNDGYWEPAWITDSYKEGTVTFTPPVLTNGDHEALVTIADKRGNLLTETWHFTVGVNTPPVLSNMTPLQYGVTDLTPLISVDYKTVNGPIVPQSVKLTVDGVEVNNIQVTAGKVTYQSGPLSDESYHTVNVTIKDNSGLSSTATWKFYTNGNNYPDMADSNVSNCTTCHAGYTGLSSHPLKLVEDSHNYKSCVACHSFISQPADCAACHKSSHGTSTTISYNAINYDSTFPLRIKTNREMVDCIICHQPGANTLGHYSFPDPRYALVAATKPVDGHDIPELHKNTETSCNKCHAQSLTKEHARPGSVDKAGEAITCNTCHKSTNPDVIKAIADKNTKCDACHVNANHDQLHVWDGFDANCETCHANTLTTEHLSNVKTVGSSKNDCATCHESDNKAVKRTIASKNLSCTGCHPTAHGLQLVDSFPSDIPRYPGYQWSSPNEASLFLGESTTPANYESGQVAISNRSVDITVEQVWKYYNEQTDTRMSVKGWALKSGSFTLGASNFVAEYEKEGRFVTIKCYTSPLTGSKIEVWYK